MNKPNILPIDQWSARDPGCTLATMQDPCGGEYDPNAAPALIRADAALGPALERARGSAMKVTVVLGMQEVEADLGEPGTFEALMDTTQLYGDTTLGYTPQTPGTYGRRAIYGAFCGVKVFNSIDWGVYAEPATHEGITNMHAMSVAAGARVAVAERIGAENLPQLRMIGVLGAAAVTNALEWAMVGHACAQVQRYARRPDAVERPHLVMSFNPAQRDVPRKFAALGAVVHTVLPRVDHWPHEVVDEAFRTSATMESGTIAVR